MRAAFEPQGGARMDDYPGISMRVSPARRKLIYFAGILVLFLSVTALVVLMASMVAFFSAWIAIRSALCEIPLLQDVNLVDFFLQSGIPLPALLLQSIVLLLVLVFMPILEFGMTVLMFLEGCLIIRSAKVTRMNITPEGIQFISPGVEMRSSWINIKAAVNKSHLGGLRHFDVFTLDGPAQQAHAWWIPFWGRKPKLEIPLSLFPDWRERELGQAAKKNAPWIMESGKAQTGGPASPPDPSAERRP
jgi:hypothetical protein